MHPKVNELNNKRIELNISIAFLVKELKINKETLRKFFNGMHEPKIGLYFKIEEYLKNKEVWNLKSNLLSDQNEELIRFVNELK